MKPVERCIRQYNYFVRKEGEFVSSKKLMKYFNISDRKVINQDVHFLKENGCKFESVPGKGYKMISHCSLEDFALNENDRDFRDALTVIEMMANTPKVKKFIKYALECIAYRRISEGEKLFSEE